MIWLDMIGLSVKQVEQQGKEDSFQYNALNRIKESSEFNTLYEYNVRGNRQTLQYAYNGDGLLVGRTEGPNQIRYYYDGDQIIAEASVVNGTSQLKARYIRGKKLEDIQYIDGTKVTGILL
ncbi:hypothetical protein [Paenibacillus polymyxa]|uniref:hypothetical protein n=1 Tax=Paenibacillus polymyxa TaxID=1406 RepID=UPI002AB48F33|nr:hypothetical protein [Paenibacillus polymyxa]MDY8025662.1 hypothetical protein [Paenibacillus polymyxa]